MSIPGRVKNSRGAVGGRPSSPPPSPQGNIVVVRGGDTAARDRLFISPAQNAPFATRQCYLGGCPRAGVTIAPPAHRLFISPAPDPSRVWFPTHRVHFGGSFCMGGEGDTPRVHRCRPNSHPVHTILHTTLNASGTRRGEQSCPLGTTFSRSAVDFACGCVG